MAALESLDEREVRSQQLWAKISQKMIFQIRQKYFKSGTQDIDLSTLSDVLRLFISKRHTDRCTESQTKQTDTREIRQTGSNGKVMAAVSELCISLLTVRL